MWETGGNWGCAARRPAFRIGRASRADHRAGIIGTPLGMRGSNVNFFLHLKTKTAANASGPDSQAR